MFIRSWKGCKHSLHLKNRLKTQFVTNLIFQKAEGKSKMQLSQSSCVRQVAGNVY